MRHIRKCRYCEADFISSCKYRHHCSPECRFWSRIYETFLPANGLPDACWEYNGSKDTSGYGLIIVDGVSVKAHRFSWKLHNGEVPDGKCVLHKCDNRLCCNPAHLFTGTAKDNSDDMFRKGRQNKAFGERARSVLTESQALAVRRLYDAKHPRNSIAALFNISLPTVKQIGTRKTWRHL